MSFEHVAAILSAEAEVAFALADRCTEKTRLANAYMRLGQSYEAAAASMREEIAAEKDAT